MALPSGARYNPAANSWTAISDAPSGRYYHTATWSGSELIVWGGPGLAPRGLKYNLGTDSWSLISTNGQPEAKASHSAVWSGNSVIVSLAGVDIGQSVLVAGGCYINAGGYPLDDRSRPMMDQGSYSEGPITIGDGVWIGTGAIILDGVTIGPHAVISAGAVVARDIPEGAIAAGIPARPIWRLDEQKTPH